MRISKALWIVAFIWFSIGLFNGYLLTSYFQGTHTPEEEQVDTVVEVQVDTVAELTSILAGGKSFAQAPHFFRIAQKIHGIAYWFDDVDPFMVARLVYTESRGDSLAVSSVGAVGLGQIRPSVWLGEFPQCGDDLRKVRDNLCYTIHILDYYQKSSPTQEIALLSYVGCLHRHYSCVDYPGKVLGD